MDKAEAEVALRLAIGRIFRLASRPKRNGDAQKYEDARRIALEAADVLGIDHKERGLGYCRPGWNFGNLSTD